MGTRLTWASRSLLRGGHLAGCGLALAALCAVGCGRGGPSLVPVKCRVLLDGKPVEGAGVGFVPVGGGPAASATTDADGRFQLMTMNQPGVPEGRYLVTVIKVEDSGLNPDGTIAPGGIKTKWLVPKKYSDAAMSGLTADVGRDGLEQVFELSSR